MQDVKSGRRSLWAPILGLVGIIGVVVLGRGESIRLMANEDLPTAELADGLLQETAIKIAAGTVVSVTGCVDLKHYIVPEVQFGERRLLVVTGKYRLERQSYLRAWHGRIVWSCP